MIIAGTSLTHWFTRFGEAEILLPVAIAVAVWMILSSRSARTASTWLVPLGVAATITTISKIAFIGWGIGIASINFTGFSGHAMFSAAIYPVLAHAFTTHLRQRGETRVPQLAIAAAYLFAAAIAYSRVRIGAHSYSEIVTGYALGAAASGSALWLMGHGLHRMPVRWAVIGLVGWMVVMPLKAAPSQTHGVVTWVALTLADRDRPYTRADLHRAKVAEAEATPFY
jgi:membrane-associated phospholipid phosphatase